MPDLTPQERDLLALTALERATGGHPSEFPCKVAVVRGWEILRRRREGDYHVTIADGTELGARGTGATLADAIQAALRAAHLISE